MKTFIAILNLLLLFPSLITNTNDKGAVISGVVNNYKYIINSTAVTCPKCEAFEA